MTIQLRPYQSDLISRVYQSYHAGNRNVLAVLPTGGGKSVIVSQIILDGHLQGLSECVIAHRNELVGQMSMHVARRGIPHRIIASKAAVGQITAEHRREFGRSFVNPNAPCSVVSVDTLIARQDQLRAWAAQVQRWTIDEAHHATGNSARPQHINKWSKAIAMFPNAYGLGVTATPSRADGVGLGRWQSDGTDGDGPFDDMIIGPSMRDLIDIGALSDYEIAVPESDFSIDESLVAASGDWSTKRMREASKRSHIVGDVVVEYQRRALGKRAICFATDVETATEMAARFNEAGITAAAVSAKTPTETRNEYIRRFRDGRITMLVNVDLFGEGFDVPAVEVVIMARPTASLAVYLQQFGRALRPLEGKPFGLVIDHVSNWKRHSFPDKPHIWTLDRRDKRSKRQPDPDDIPLTACRECSRPYERIYSACPYCGHQPVPAGGGGRSIDMVDGDLMLLDRDKLAELRAAMTLETPADVAARVTHVAGELAGRGAANRAIERHAAQADLVEAIEQWAGVRRAMGESDSVIHRRFWHALGVDVLTAMAGKRSEMDALTNVVRSWYGDAPVEAQKKNDEQLIIEAAIERGDQGFRGGWVDVSAAKLLTGVGKSVEHTLEKMGFIYRHTTAKTVRSDHMQKTVWAQQPDRNTDDFWVSNGYTSDHQSVFESLIQSGNQGFRGGWVNVKSLREQTKMNNGESLAILKQNGFVSCGLTNMSVNGETIYATVYNRDPNADPADFWVSNGYFEQLDTVKKIKRYLSEGRKGYRGGWLSTNDMKRDGLDTVNSVRRCVEYLGYKPVRKIHTNKTFPNGKKISTFLYNRDGETDTEKFWIENDYVSDFAKLATEHIRKGGRGYQNGWVSVTHLSDSIGLNDTKKTGEILKSMGYHLIGLKFKQVNGRQHRINLAHTDPNADPADFWSSNGYV